MAIEDVDRSRSNPEAFAAAVAGLSMIGGRRCPVAMSS